MSQPRVTVIIGQDGQRSATISSGKVSDRNTGIFASRKRSVKDRLGGNSNNVSSSTVQTISKRQRLEGQWKQRGYEEEHQAASFTNSHHASKLGHDLRHKLDQKVCSSSRQLSNCLDIVGSDLRDRISGSPHPTQGRRIVVRRPPSMPPSKGIPIIRALPSSAAIESRVKVVQKVSVTIEQPTVSKLLQSLGLSKYSITFQAEEIDMTALRNMNDDDLKELGLPMGPRKKILIALSARK